MCEQVEYTVQENRIRAHALIHVDFDCVEYGLAGYEINNGGKIGFGKQIITSFVKDANYSLYA